MMWKDFKEFAFQGNVLDLAIAVIIGAAFGQIVTSLVENVIMPIIGGLTAGVSFEHLYFTIGGSDVLYGNFIQSIFDFIIIAASIFLFVRLLMNFKRNVEEERSEEHTSELQSRFDLVCRLLLEKKKIT